MTPLRLFFYIIATAAGLGCSGILAGLLYVAWLTTLGWLKGGTEGGEV